MSLGSLLASKGEDSEEDEDTEYFDAMEDSTSFITVITEPSEGRWAGPRRRGHAPPAPPSRAPRLSAPGVSFQSCSRCWSRLG